MRLKDSVIAWEAKPEGRVMVEPFGFNPLARYSTTGGRHAWTQTCKDINKLKAFVLTEAMSMIVRDGLDPMTVHTALLDIDEYLDVCAEDMPGVAQRRYEETP